MKRYMVSEDKIVAEFDRIGGDAAEPDELSIEAALIQMQKNIYVYCAAKLGLSTGVSGAEVLKVWPTRLDVRRSRPVEEIKGLRHEIAVTEMRRLEGERYYVVARSSITGGLTIDGSAMIQVLGSHDG